MKHSHPLRKKRVKLGVALSAVVVSPMLILSATGSSASAECVEGIGISPMSLPKDLDSYGPYDTYAEAEEVAAELAAEGRPDGEVVKEAPHVFRVLFPAGGDGC